MAILSWLKRASGGKPFEPFGKGSIAQKAGTRDVEPLGPYRSNRVLIDEIVRSAPGRKLTNGAFIGDISGLASQSRFFSRIFQAFINNFRPLRGLKRAVLAGPED
jgi:hypothetical protein